ncbi:MAG TPA: hypothetical protein VLI67_03430 [Vicinamibacteria bacterium]|nr:hypothetical protein [Vicinamibacteria bacterium]
MAFDLRRIQAEAQAAPLASPYPLELSVAVVCDCFRLAGLVPPSAKGRKRAAAGGKAPLREEQTGMLAHLLATTSLRDETVRALGGRRVDVTKALADFFGAIAPLTAEMIQANAFRREEFLRRWIESIGGEVAGEGSAESAERIEQLDYRRTLAEYDRAEKARKDEAERRARLLKEAADREAAARGWRE